MCIVFRWDLLAFISQEPPVGGERVDTYYIPLYYSEGIMIQCRNVSATPIGQMGLEMG